MRDDGIFDTAVFGLALFALLYGYVAIIRGRVEFSRNAVVTGRKAHLAGCLFVLFAVVLLLYFLLRPAVR
jgi:uncharacterized membrane protein YozB (DUF420 family)